jgi:hypothetical protein
VNPTTISWEELLPAVQAVMDPPVDTVSLDEWVEALRSSADRLQDIDINPALKLVDFFSELRRSADHPRLETTKALKKSMTMAQMGPVTQAWMHNWMKQWALPGFVTSNCT